MKLSESDLLEQWMQDPSFMNWAKETNKADFQKWEAYLTEHPAYRPVAETGKFALLHLQAQPIEVAQERSEAALKRLKKQLQTTQKIDNQPVKVVPFYKKWQTVAAVLTLIALNTWWFLGNALAPSEVVLTTNFGETKNWVLSDQSKVTLNANSTLKYVSDNPRQVWLDGEAFFEVAKKPSTGEQFQVQTNDLTVKVLGTVFNVNSRYEQTQVFLEEGKVRLALTTKAEEDVDMQPGDLLSYSKKQEKIIQHKTTKTIAPTSWLQGVIRFEAASLATVLKEVSTIYGIQFEKERLERNEATFSGGIPNNDLAITLSTLEEIYGLSIEQIGAKYRISTTRTEN